MTSQDWLEAITLLDVVGLVAIVAASVTFIVRVGRPVVSLVSSVHDFIEDWRGTPEEQDGSGRVIQQAQPGVLARLDRIEHEVTPNHGGSAHDQLMKAITELADEFRAFADESTHDRKGLHKRISELGPTENTD